MIIQDNPGKGGAEEERQDYYSYRAQNLSQHFDQYWIETKSQSRLPPGDSSYSLDLPFDFPFYSGSVRRITVYPGGWVELDSGAGYIAPLSANLDPHHEPQTASLSYWISHRNLSLTLQWRNAVVRDLPARLPFTFRLRLWASGLVEFLYNKLGIQLQHLLVFDNNIKIGLGDSSNRALEVARKSVKEKTMISISRVSRPGLTQKQKEDIAITESCLYYDASLVQSQETAKKLWVSMMDSRTGRDNQIVKLPFPFPFFGNLSTEVMLTGDGTIYLDPWRTNNNNKTHRQIAGWRRNISGARARARPARVMFRHSSDSFTVQWEEGSSRTGYKTLLQVIMRPSGDLDFVYQELLAGSERAGVVLGLRDGPHHLLELSHLAASLHHWSAVRIRKTNIRSGLYLSSLLKIFVPKLPKCLIILDLL